jgi:hypothetical protein
MKVVCVDNKNGYGLIIGKTYEVIKEDKYGYYIIDEYGTKGYYIKILFKPISEIRNEKIDILLDL